MQRLADQVAIVTGGAMGIGGATSRRLAEEGAKVLIVDVNGDAGSPGDIEAMAHKAVDLWGRLDSLVNNAYGRIDGGQWQRVGGL